MCVYDRSTKVPSSTALAKAAQNSVKRYKKRATRAVFALLVALHLLVLRLVAAGAAARRVRRRQWLLPDCVQRDLPAVPIRKRPTCKATTRNLSSTDCVRTDCVVHRLRVEIPVKLPLIQTSRLAADASDDQEPQW